MRISPRCTHLQIQASILKGQMKWFLVDAEFKRAAKIRKVAVYRFLISLLVPELPRFKDD